MQGTTTQLCKGDWEPIWRFYVLLV